MVEDTGTVLLVKHTGCSNRKATSGNEGSGTQKKTTIAEGKNNSTGVSGS